jgi:hypothetical protein
MKASRRQVVVVLATMIALMGSLLVVPASASTAADLLRIRTGRHATFDRVVLDFRSGTPQQIRKAFVAQLRADPSDKVVNLPGNRFLTVTMHNAGSATSARTIRTPQLRNVRAVAITGNFEAVLTVGLGLRHTSWTRVFTLRNPTRVVIDIGR